MSEGKLSCRSAERIGLVCFAYKALILMLLVGVIGIFSHLLAQITELKSAFKRGAPALEEAISSKIENSTQDVLDHIAISEKIAGLNSEIVLIKAKKYECLRVIAQAKLKLADGTFGQEELSLIETLNEYKVRNALKELSQILKQKPLLLFSDDELAVALGNNLSLTTKAVFIGQKPESYKEDVKAFDKFKDRAMYYLSKLISIEHISYKDADSGLTIFDVNKYKHQNLAYYLMKNSEYGVLLEIMDKHSVSGSESIFNMLKLKYQIKERLIKIEELLLE